MYKIAIVEVESLQPFARVADGDDFGVRRRIIARGHLIAAAADNFISLHHNRAERPALASPHHLDRETNCFTHKFLFMKFNRR